MRKKFLKQIYVWGLAGGLIAGAFSGCSLDDIVNLGISCDNVRGIRLSSGVCIDSDDENKCVGCSDADVINCNKYIKEGVFKHLRCPNEYVCTTVESSSVYDKDINMCILRRNEEQNCDEEQVFVCDRGDMSTCEKSCDYCDPKFTCIRIVGTENGGDECSNGQRKCDGSDAYMCVNGKWMFNSSCPDGCDSETGHCRRIQRPGEEECVSGSHKCDLNDVLVCRDGDWVFDKNCANGCVDGACEEVSGQEPETCEEGAADCRDNIPLRCLYGNWAEGAACERKCENGVCINSDDPSSVPPPSDCTDGEKKCADDALKICSQGEWFTQQCSFGCANDQCIEIGAKCSSAAFKQMCINENSNALICQDGVITKIRCAEQNCSTNPNDPGLVSCTDKCSADSTRRCAPACGNDGKTGYFWNNSGKVQTIACQASACNVTDGYVNCGGASCTKDSKERCVPACSPDKKTGYWMSNNNKIHQINCPNADCFYYKGTLTCGEPEYCTAEDYVPACSSKQSSQGTYCSSDGVVKTYTCKNSFCKIKYDGTCEGAASCEGGRYSVYDYPNGFLDCVADPSETPDIPESCKYGSSNALCIGQELYICGSDNKYARLMTCSEGNPCTVKNGYGQCGEFETCSYQKDPAKCDGQDLYVCNSNGIYIKKETCSNDKKCTVNSEGYGQCGSFEACTYKTSSAKCDGQDLYVCGSNNFYHKIETCSDEKPCSVQNGYGQCGKIEACETNAPALCKNNNLYICKNHQYQKVQSCTEDKPCKIDQASGFGYCGSSEKCIHGSSPAVCKGNDLYVCNRAGFMVKKETCEAGTSCKVTAHGYGLCLEDGKPGLCKKGDPSICLNDNKDLYICDGFGYYKKYKTCANNETCRLNENYGECIPNVIPASCQKGAKAYCVDNKLYLCNASAGVYYLKKNCGSKTCHVKSNGYGQCTEKCISNKCDGSDMYICSDGYYDKKQCETGLVCKLSSTGYAKCLPPEVPLACTDESPAICIGKKMYLCNKKFHTYSLGKTCAANETCTVSSRGYGDCQVLPADISGSCTGAKCSDIDHNAYYCNQNTHTYYFQDSGKCTAQKKCVSCSNGFGGCGITCK